MLVETTAINSANSSFLKDLFFKVKSEVFTGVAKELQANLLDMQFKYQQEFYFSNWPNAEHKLLIFNNKAIGQVIIEKSEANVQIIDISILPAMQKQGLGTHYLLSLLAQTRKENRTAILSVDKNNRALTLYQRIGFRIITDDQTHYVMTVS